MKFLTFKYVHKNNPLNLQNLRGKNYSYKKEVKGLEATA